MNDLFSLKIEDNLDRRQSNIEHSLIIIEHQIQTTNIFLAIIALFVLLILTLKIVFNLLGLYSWCKKNVVEWLIQGNYSSDQSPA